VGASNGIIAVAGVCTPERRRYAQRVPGQLVLDLATEADLLHTLERLGRSETAAENGVQVVCVVDARHMLDDIRDASPLLTDPEPGDDRGDVGARGRQAVRAIEVATAVVLVNWEELPTAELSVQMALASHLNPTAGIRLSRSPREDLAALRLRAAPASPLLERAGWVMALNAEHDPYMTDQRVSTVRYEQLRAFHPGRLVRALDRIEGDEAGLVLRSAGFCRLATRPGIGRWEQVGSAMWIDPLVVDGGEDALGQDIAFTGLDLHETVLRRILDRAALTDEELAAGPRAWRRFADPLPAWPSWDVSPS
jgi:G3E family GTPase